MLKKLLLLFLFPLLAFAQKQPKVGLVLSGGGAKGFAHIGVLKEIEKAGVQIDYIGGTSMGAIIGGMYAAGYSVGQIEQLIEKTNFNNLMQDKIPRREKTYFEKTYVEKHTFSLPLHKGTINLPLGLSKGQNALNLLTELFSTVDNVTDFSKLPIPFYCVATDIETGEEVVLEKGSLPLSIRASSSFPSLLNPVEVDGKILVDGGVVNNFPVDKMKEKDIDIIIGINVQGRLSKKEELNSITEILKQIINFQMYNKSAEQIKLLDIHIKPNVSDYTVTSFNNADEIIKLGQDEALKFSVVLKEISKKQTSKRAKTKVSLNKKKFLVNKIFIKGNENYSRNYILGKLHLVEGDSVSYSDISHKINTLTATKNFERIDYHLMKSFDGKKLILIVKEEKITSFLRIGIHYDELYKTGILLNYNHKKLLFPNDEISFDFIAGDNIRYNLQYFIDNGIIPSYGLSSTYTDFSTNIPFNSNSNINKINIDYRDLTTKLYTQTTLDKKFALGFGIEHKRLKIKTETVLTNNKATFFDNSDYVSPFAFLRLDTFDKEIYPTNGFYADFGLKWFLFSNRNRVIEKYAINDDSFNTFSQINGTISNVFNIANKFTFQYIADGGVTLGNKSSGIFNYSLGGYNKNLVNNFRPFYGYEIGALSNQSYLKLELSANYQIFKKNYLTLIANYARVDSNAFDLESLIGNRQSGYAAGYGFDSLLGPIELKYAWSPEHDDGFFLFNLGFWF